MKSTASKHEIKDINPTPTPSELGIMIKPPQIFLPNPNPHSMQKETQKVNQNYNTTNKRITVKLIT